VNNNEKLLLEEIKELKEIINNYHERDLTILNLYKEQNIQLYRSRDPDNKLDNDIIINKFKNILEREKDLHKIFLSKYLEIEKCDNCGKIYLSGKYTYCRFHNDYILMYFCSKECSDKQR
jgi:hypothetical protein